MTGDLERGRAFAAAKPELKPIVLSGREVDLIIEALDYYADMQADDTPESEAQELRDLAANIGTQWDDSP